MKITLVGHYANGALLDVLRERGWNQSQLAGALGVSPTRVSLWMRLRDYPKQPALCRRIEQVTGRLIEDLFPQPEVTLLRGKVLPVVEVSRELDPVAMLTDDRRRQLMGPEAVVAREEVHDLLRQALTAILPREQEIIRRRFGLEPFAPQRYDEISQDLGCSRERIRQIEARALRCLRDREPFLRRAYAEMDG